MEKSFPECNPPSGSCGFFFAPRLFPENRWGFSSIFLAIWGAFLLYSYGPGYRRKTRKFIKHNLGGKPIPKTFRCVMDEHGVSNETDLAVIRFPWSSVKKIQYYKDNLEIQAAGFLTHLPKEHAPDISALNEMWEKYR